MPPIASSHKALSTYYDTLTDLHGQQIQNEGGLRRAFAALLATLGKTEGWTLAEEQTLPSRIRPDGVLLDEFRFPRGYWEAKDSADDLEAEIRKKLERGYPQTNIIFEDGRRAVLVQNRRRSAEASMSDRVQLAALLAQFFGHTEANIEGFHAAVREFQARIPDLARSVEQTIEEERGKNQRFAAAFGTFHEICRNAIDPNISADEIEKMLVQHLLTERLFRTVFDDPDFTRRNAIANEIEKVVRSLTWNRSAFLKRLDPFYLAIEEAARTIDDYAQKQTFLNTVYERFFQGYSRDQADTHGVVYTPQPIVDFMVASVDQVLKTEFGKSLSDEGVCILDPATGTGNFIVNILRKISRRDLKRKYQQELFANEIMLLPYYIASLNIEHAYNELTGEYAPFEGICFTDTLDLAETQQLSLFAEENTDRVQRQKDAKITVIIGNPPYNVGQMSENDNNKNRRYREIDKRVRETYAKDSQATNKNALGDVYVRFFRWATDRLQGQNGIVCYVSNNSFIDQIAFDGMRKHLQQDFQRIYVINLRGDIRKDSMRDGIPLGEKHTIFGLAAMVGISITILIKNDKYEDSKIAYHSVDWRSTRQEKLIYLDQAKSVQGIDWQYLQPNKKQVWITEGLREDFDEFLAIGAKEAKIAKGDEAQTIFKTYSGGVKSNRDEWAYDFNHEYLAQKVQTFIELYNTEVDRWQRRTDRTVRVDDFVRYDDTAIKWSRDLKLDLQRGNHAVYDLKKIRHVMYRPFTRQYVFFDRVLNEEVYQQPQFFPTPASEDENIAICTVTEAQIPFSAQITSVIPCIHYGGRQIQCFPFYVYDEDGSNRRENITDWALAQFQDAYGAGITKRDIFHYVYGLLHHPGYRERYAENLKRDLPRLPLLSADQYLAIVAAGTTLAQLHLNYETAPEYRLTWLENREIPFSWRVNKLRLSSDKTQLIVNESLTLANIPAECFRYRLGNRSALEWIIDQYQVSTDKRSGIVSDPNRPEDEEYIVRLIGRVITVSIETMRIVDGLPEWKVA